MNYIRLIRSGRGNNEIDIKGIDNFKEVLYNHYQQEIIDIGGVPFISFHRILNSKNQSIFTAYRSISKSDILFIVWKGLPYTHHIEQGGDIMLQEMLKNGIKNLIIDNTYVSSIWMNPKMKRYFHEVWYPSLIELGLKKFVHIQSSYSLGMTSFELFKENLSLYLERLAFTSSKQLFQYIPMQSDPKLSWIENMGTAVKLI
jgi:hypothetical protein